MKIRISLPFIRLPHRGSGVLTFTTALLLSVAFPLLAKDIQTLTLPPAANMVRAELHFRNDVETPRAVLVLCPGVNGSGRGLIQSEKWQAFAKQHSLGLVGLSFASPLRAIHDGTGYYYASKGSGKILLDGVRQIYRADLPLLFYGTSGGAHFTSRFTEWKPKRVLTWCAYSAGWWDEPQPAQIAPPGIVACGDADPRYGASLIYFKQGRAAGKPWLWVSLPDVGHRSSPELEAFARLYFSTVLSEKKRSPVIVDIDRKTFMSNEEALTYPSLSGWLPTSQLFEPWSQVHQP